MYMLHYDNTYVSMCSPVMRGVCVPNEQSKIKSQD